jgi:hypothetical protein
MNNSDPGFLSRRRFVGLCGAATCALPAFGQPANFPTVGSVRVKSVSITGVGPLGAKSRPVIGIVDVKTNGTLCALGLDGGIHFQANVELEALPGSHPASFGALTLVQNTMFHHKRRFKKTECVNSPGWTLDGQYPYLNLRVPCRPGANHIVMQDAPNVFVEQPPYEHVWVEPQDQFRTFVLWEAMPNNQRAIPPSSAPRIVLARVDWMWQGEAINAGASTPGVTCTSTDNINAWGTTGNVGAKITNIAIGRAATMPLATGKPITPVYSPLAVKDAWVTC